MLRVMFRRRTRTVTFSNNTLSWSRNSGYEMWVWIGNWIYLTLTIRCKYYSAKSISHSPQLTTHAMNFLGLLSFISPLVPASNGWRSPSSVLEHVPVTRPQRLLTHSALTIALAPLHTLKSSPFWSCSRTVSTCHWLRPPTISNLLRNVMPCNNYWTWSWS
jgi:hypothetical protein